MKWGNMCLIDAIFLRIKEVTGARNMKEIAEKLGVAEADISAARKTALSGGPLFPDSLLSRLSHIFYVNSNWLLYGMGPKYILPIAASQN